MTRPLAIQAGSEKKSFSAVHVPRAHLASLHYGGARMSLGTVLVVLIVSTAGVDPAASALEASAQELLGQTAKIRLILTPVDPSDVDTLQRAGAADGVVELAWSDDHSSALLHCYVTHDARWVDRRITFSADDEEPERGRLLGFAIASMFPRLVSLPEPAEKPVDSTPAQATSRSSPAPKPSAQAIRLELELAASATTGVRGPADAAGGMVGMRLPLAHALSLHAAIGARVGEIPVAHASTRTAMGELGLAWVTSAGDSPLQLGLRADFLASWLEVTRALANDGEIESRARWTFGGAALVEGGHRFSRRLGVYVGAGTEVLLSETDIYAEGQFEAKLPTFRIVGELGLRGGF